MLDALMLTCERLADLLAIRRYWHHLERVRPPELASKMLQTNALHMLHTKALTLLHEDIPGTLSVYLGRHLDLYLLA